MSSYIFNKFISSVDVYGNKKCIEDANGELNYREFHRAVYKVVEILIELVPLSTKRRRQPIVLIMAKNSIEQVILTYACCLCRITWVPINYNLPERKLVDIVDSLNPEIIYCDQEFQYLLDGLACKGSQHLSLDREYLLCEPYDPTPGDFLSLLERNSYMGDLAYIIFTSGSTGSPKGVMISYDSLDNYLSISRNDLEFDHRTHNLSITPYYFDAPLGTIYLTLLFGGALYIYQGLLHPRAVEEILIKKEITYIGLTPGLLSKYLEVIRKIYLRCKLRVVGIGGDNLVKSDIAELFELIPSLKILNRYGPTETTSVCSSYIITDCSLKNTDNIPIGYPLRNVVFEIIGDDDHLIEGPGRGQLIIAGRQNMMGYWNDEELSKNSFWQAEGKYYLTGDYVERLHNGCYVYLGRVSRMVKCDGHRVYLAEIEVALNKIPFVKSSLCFESPKIPGEILAVLVVDAMNRRSFLSISTFLRNELPPYMFPKEYYFTDDLELNSVGKYDAQLLYKGVTSGELERAV